MPPPTDVDWVRFLADFPENDEEGGGWGHSAIGMKTGACSLSPSVDSYHISVELGDVVVVVVDSGY